MERSSHIHSPLLALHEAAEAETQPYGDSEIVTTFGEPQAEYAAIHKSAGVMDRPFRAVIELSGKDRLSFLNGLISNLTWDKTTKQPIPAGSCVYAFLLNLKGRIVADLQVVELGKRTLIELDAALAEPVVAVFDKYLFAEQVKMTVRLGELHCIGVFGPKSREIVGWPGAAAAAEFSCGGVDVVGWRDDPTGTDGVHLIVNSVDAEALWRHLTEKSDAGYARGRPVGWAAFNACRIEAGRPLFGIDFAGVAPATAYPSKKLRDEADDSVPGVLPAETGPLFARAVNLTKCYIGQEVVARMHARQQFARQIVGFRMQDDALPMAGSPVQDDSGTQVGIVTSSTVSPVMSNACIGLALVKKPHFADSTELRIPAEGAIRAATVVSMPFRG